METIKKIYEKNRIIKYSLVEDHDYLHFIENDLVRLFGDDYIIDNMHQIGESVFFLRASVEQHEKVREILSQEDLFDFYTKELNIDSLFKIEDVTDKVFNNIHDFEGMENIHNTDLNLFIDVYYTMDKDDILDKISKSGMESLNEHDMNILKS